METEAVPVKKTIICGLLFLLLHVPQAFAQQVNDYLGDIHIGIIIAGYTGTSREVTIPDTINGMPVMGIGESAFAGKHLTGVVMPGSVIFIDKGTFAGNCLTSVTVPEGVTTIRAGAFEDNRLTSIILPPSIRACSHYENMTKAVKLEAWK